MSSTKDLPGQKLKKPPVEATAWCYTASKGETEFSFVWTIENFSRKIEFYNYGKFLTSDAFKIDMGGEGTAWQLKCFPNGNTEDSAKNVSLYLRADNKEAMNTRKVSSFIAIVGADYSKVVKRSSSHCFEEKEREWGWNKFVSHEHLKSAEANLLVEDRLTILCVVKFVGQELTTSGISKPFPTTPLDIEMGPQEEEEPGLVGPELLQTGYQADVEVVCDERTFSCHKVILGSRSSVLRATLEHDMKEKASGKITIKDIEPNIVEDMLTHMYGGGEIENLEEKADKLLVVADQYDLKKLKIRCEDLLAGSLDISTCLDCLVLADLHSTERLKPFVIKFIAENLREVANQDNWKEMQTNHPKVFV